MLKIITTLILLVIAMLAQAQVVENRMFSGVSKVEIRNGIELIFTESDQQSMIAEAKDSTDLKNLITEIQENTLRIYYLNAKIGKIKNNLKVYLSAKNISFFNAGSKAKISVTDQIASHEINVTLDSGASFEGNIKSDGKVTLNSGLETVFNSRVETASFKGYFDSNARVNISGTAQNAVINASENAFCTARNFISETITVNAQGDSLVLIHAKDIVNLDVIDSAKVTYTGYPEKIKLNINAFATIFNKSSTFISYSE